MKTFHLFLIIFAVVVIIVFSLSYLGYIKLEKNKQKNETKKILTELNQIENATKNEERILQEEISPNITQLLINKNTTFTLKNVITTINNMINQTENELDMEINTSTIDELFI